MKYTAFVISLFVPHLLATPAKRDGQLVATTPQLPQDESLTRRDCPGGYGLCPNGGCCPLGGECCNSGDCCDPGYQCWISHDGYPGCCPNGEVCKCAFVLSAA